RFPTPAARLGRSEGGEENAVGRVVSVKERRVRGLEIVEARLQDESGTFVAKWIGRRRFVYGRFKEGMRLFVRGRVERSLAEATVTVTQHALLGERDAYRGRMEPIYRASKNLTTRKIAAVVANNLPRMLLEPLDDPIPAAIRDARGYPEVREAYRNVHAPKSPGEASVARERFIFAEFLLMATSAALRRRERERERDAPPLAVPPELAAEFEGALPFALTGAQRRVIGEIWSDMAREIPMNRLLQGDVGSGKTLVAAAAIVLAARSGMQSALMAPTEILAQQHAHKLAPLLLPFGIPLEVVLGSQGLRERRRSLDRIAGGEAGVAVGTHALLTEGVEFPRLGLAVIDEQHRFGVEQRALLRSKGSSPHTLHMTATPIPRTLAQTVFADLDISTIDELPPGRVPIETYAVRTGRLSHVYEFIRSNVRLGHQAYVVAPAIEEGENGLASVLEVSARLQSDVFPELRIGVVHGRLSGRDKDETMQRFARGQFDVLVATTVIEVGVDVPNASLMVVLDAQRYGLAQLHQLRGRVGRGGAKSYCVLVYPDDTEETKRLEILTGSTDGFVIADADLAMRGTGQFSGTAQSGKSELRHGDLQNDFPIYREARAEAERILGADPQLARPEHAALRAALEAGPSVRRTLASS
ncbi:MAG: ATP-dependent DNA helicase RecG, partial [Vulcanimicrobiaceae bacterium]